MKRQASKLKMWRDPIVEEVRRVRRQIAREVGGGSEGFYRHILKVQEALGDRVVSLGPPPMAKKQGESTTRSHRSAPRMIVFDKHGWRFNYRVAGILIHKGRVLLEHNIKSGDCCLPGGRVEFGESASEALLREAREELGVPVKIGRLVWAVDNFFQIEGIPYQEVSFYFMISLLQSSNLPLGQKSFPNRSTSLTLLKWHEIAGLMGVLLYPSFLRTGLLSLPDNAAYMVHRDKG